MLVRSVFVLLILEFLDVASSLLSCPVPRIRHGRVRLKQRARIAKFECQARYTLVGNVYTSCKDGEWDVPFPVCVRSGCAVPKIENGVKMSQFDDAWITYFCMPAHQLVGSQVIYCDGDRWNASAPLCVLDSKESPQLTCDFENPDLCGWRQDELHDFDWRRLNGQTPSTFLYTGPSYDHTLGKDKNGYYMYIESTSRLENDTARFISPIYENSYAKDGCFSFFYHMFGKTCGGLRVYQKPEKLDIVTMLQPENRDRYILFEKWGNLGNFWFQSVTNLTDFSDDFQIIIEGIRGSSYTSDIAIDDVAIMQGEICTDAAIHAVTPRPSSEILETCSGRCRETPLVSLNHSGCGCSFACFTDHNCCHDFFEICIFAPDLGMLDEVSSSSEEAPQTQKLVQTTPQTTSSSTTSSTTTSTTKSTTTSTTTTTPKPTTTRTKPTTTKKIVTTRKITTKVPITTRIPTTKPTTKVLPKTTTKVTPKTTINTIKVVTTTQASHGISRTFENHDIYHKLVKDAKKERKDTKSGTSWIIIPILGVVLCACAGVWLVYARSVRGRITIARLRGRVQNDQEVRYLSTDVDDD